MDALKRHVERIVRPIRGSTWRKNKMREELLAHLEQRVKEALAQDSTEEDAAARAIAALGGANELRAELQSTVPMFERVMSFSIPLKGGAEQWFDRRPGESTLRYAAIRTVYIAIAMFAAMSLPPLIDELPQWIAIITGETVPEAQWIMRVALIPGAVFAVSITVTFFMHLFADVSGIRHVLSRVSQANIIRKSLALAMFVIIYLTLMLGSSIFISQLLNPLSAAHWDGLMAVMSVLLRVLAVFIVFGIPFVAWAMTKEHDQYMKWGRLEIGE